MNCPACGKKILTGFEMAENEYVAWCGHGPCPSIKANVGAFGKTEQQAIDNLIAALEKKPDWSDEQSEDLDAAAIDAADRKYQIEKDDK